MTNAIGSVNDDARLSGTSIRFLDSRSDACLVVGYGLQIRSTWVRWDQLDEAEVDCRGDSKLHAEVEAEMGRIDAERDALYTLVCLTEAKSLAGVQVQVAVQAVLTEFIAGGHTDSQRLRKEVDSVSKLIARALAKLTGADPFDLENDPVAEAA